MGFFSLFFKAKPKKSKPKKVLTPEEAFLKEKKDNYNKVIKAIKEINEIEEKEIPNFFLKFNSQKQEELIRKIEKNRKSCLKYIKFCENNNLSIEIDKKYTDEYFFKLQEKVNPKLGVENKLKFAKKEYVEIYDSTAILSDKLIKEREKTIVIINDIKSLINSIAKHPKEFNNTFLNIEIEKKKFKNVLSFKEDEKQNLKTAGLIAVGTTTAGAISGIAINKKEVKSGLKNMEKGIPNLGGKIFLVGLGAAAVTSGIYYICKNNKIQKDKKNEVEKIFFAIKELKVINTKINNSYDKITKMNDSIKNNLELLMYLKNSNYIELNESEKIQLGSLVNNTNSLACLLNEEIQ